MEFLVLTIGVFVILFIKNKYLDYKESKEFFRQVEINFKRIDEERNRLIVEAFERDVFLIIIKMIKNKKPNN
jgi:hypothetical protein